jgi:hypothetical protein
MTYADYQRYFEEAAAAEHARFDAMTVAEVIAEINADRLGSCYSIWYSLGARATPLEANDLLLNYLASDAEYLHRYHCAAALIQINRLRWEPHQLSAFETQDVEKNLATVREALKRKAAKHE